ncbi:DUF123 domain-containing protein [Halobacteriales archaeon QS_6_64_34]|nr:MAG: DUF123 domain-containing protein [Halobacteriales archaeon QS_6_64_34]
MAEGGTYTLVLARDHSGPIEVGALGAIDFPAGWYAYTGSALGSGGFSRIDRHRAVARRLSDTVGGAVPDFGCSDCDCRSHLVGCEDRAELVVAVERAHDVVVSESG